jgi:hypothetical protein
MEPRYPWQLNGMSLSETDDDADSELQQDDSKVELGPLTPLGEPWIRNVFYCHERRALVAIYQEPDGVSKMVIPQSFPEERWLLAMESVYAGAQAWPVDGECKAIEKLATLIPTHLLNSYICTGMFPETSERSKISYVFRRLRPTVAMSPRPANGKYMKVIATLCLHPIGYYQDTHAGVMVPTDDVIAHLLLCRADEHLFWRKATQHPVWDARSGI